MVARVLSLAGRTVPGSKAAIHFLVMTGSPYRYGWRRRLRVISGWSHVTFAIARDRGAEVPRFLGDFPLWSDGD
jgi:hypothetical protein